jgi:hypothetical protein
MIVLRLVMVASAKKRHIGAVDLVCKGWVASSNALKYDNHAVGAFRKDPFDQVSPVDPSRYKSSSAECMFQNPWCGSTVPTYKGGVVGPTLYRAIALNQLIVLWYGTVACTVCDEGRC